MSAHIFSIFNSVLNLSCQFLMHLRRFSFVPKLVDVCIDFKQQQVQFEKDKILIKRCYTFWRPLLCPFLMKLQFFLQTQTCINRNRSTFKTRNLLPTTMFLWRKHNLITSALFYNAALNRIFFSCWLYWNKSTIELERNTPYLLTYSDNTARWIQYKRINLFQVFSFSEIPKWISITHNLKHSVTQ